MKVEGTIAAGRLDTTVHAFSVVYSSGITTKSNYVEYSPAIVEGTLSEGTWVEVKLYGYSGGWFLARKVSVEGTVTEE